MAEVVRARGTARRFGVLITAVCAAFAALVPTAAGGVAQPPYLAAITCTGSTFCVAVGSTYKSGFVVQYAAGHWSKVASPTVSGASLRGVSCTSAANCFGVGLRGPANKTATLVERWDGKSWKVVPSPSPTGTSKLMGVSCVTTTFCFAVGSSFDDKTSTGKTLVEQWNGKAWKIVASPNSQDDNSHETWLEGVSCVSTQVCFAAGSTVSFQGSTDSVFLARWNGGAWTMSSRSQILGDLNWLHAVSCATAKTCMAVGETNSDRPIVPMMDRWNGSTWHLTEGQRHGTGRDLAFAAVSCASATMCLAVGGRNYEAPYAERWDGSKWTPTSTPPSSSSQIVTFAGVSCIKPRICCAAGASVVQLWSNGSWKQVARFS